MSLKSIIAALVVVGSSSVALAAPVTYSQSATVVRQPAQRYIAPNWNLRPTPTVTDDDCHNTTLGGDSSGYSGPIGTKTGYGWTSLTQPTRIDRGREFFTIGRQAGRFDTLKLENVKGSSVIQQVLVEFSNGKSQLVKLNERLSPGNPCITINLNGNNRSINRIVVYGSTSMHSSYQILAA